MEIRSEGNQVLRNIWVVLASPCNYAQGHGLFHRCSSTYSFGYPVGYLEGMRQLLPPTEYTFILQNLVCSKLEWDCIVPSRSSLGLSLFSAYGFCSQWRGTHGASAFGCVSHRMCTSVWNSAGSDGSPRLAPCFLQFWNLQNFCPISNQINPHAYMRSIHYVLAY